MAVKMIGPLRSVPVLPVRHSARIRCLGLTGYRGSLLAIAGSSFAYLTKDRWGRTHSVNSESIPSLLTIEGFEADMC